MTNKIDTVLKAIIDRIAGALPSDMVKNQKMSTFPVLSARSYLTIDPQCSSYPSTSINSIKAHSKEANISQVESLELGKHRSAFVQGEASAKMEDPNLASQQRQFDLILDRMAEVLFNDRVLGQWLVSSF
ncbi:hypothetical protein Tco_0946739 [Tanacetum coccineum]